MKKKYRKATAIAIKLMLLLIQFPLVLIVELGGWVYRITKYTFFKPAEWINKKNSEYQTMTIKKFIEAIGEDEAYIEKTLVYINGKPADDVSFGLVAGTNQMIVNIESYDPD